MNGDILRNESIDELMFFDGKAAAHIIYQRLREKIYSVCPDAEIRVKKTQISFFKRHMFCAVSFLPVRRGVKKRGEYVTVTFGLDHRIMSPRIDAATEPYPRRWTHHVVINSADMIDSELISWIREAAGFAAVK